MGTAQTSPPPDARKDWRAERVARLESDLNGVRKELWALQAEGRSESRKARQEQRDEIASMRDEMRREIRSLESRHSALESRHSGLYLLLLQLVWGGCILLMVVFIVLVATQS